MSRELGGNDSLDTCQKKKMQLALKIYPMFTAKFRSIDMSDKCQMSRAQPPDSSGSYFSSSLPLSKSEPRRRFRVITACSR